MHPLLLFLALYLPTTMFLSFLGRFFQPLRFYARILSCYFLLLTAAAYGVAASVALRAVGKVSIAQWTAARAFRTITTPVLGITFRLVGGEEFLEERPAVFVCNHQSELDVVALGTLFPKHCSVTAKRSLKYIPFLGWFMALSNTVFIDRSNRKSAIAAFDGAVAEIRGNRQSVWIFPEGTRSYATKPELLPFKKGAFHLAVQAQVPIVPVVVQNYNHVLRVKERYFGEGVVGVQVLAPVVTEGLKMEDVPNLAERTRSKMLETLEELSGKTLMNGNGSSNGTLKED